MGISDTLFSKMNEYLPFPDGIEPIPKMINDTSFFPGGIGFFDSKQVYISPEILILGQDFSNVEEHKKMLDGKIKDINSQTWKRMLLLLAEAGIDPNKCFYTNAFMGLRKEGSSVGKFIGFQYPGYLRNNDEFLKFQLDIIKPKLIIVMGKFAPLVLARLSTDLKPWESIQSFNDIDERKIALMESVNFGNHCSTCCIIVHTSYRHLNVRSRKYKEFSGDDAEIELIKDAIKISRKEC